MTNGGNDGSGGGLDLPRENHRIILGTREGEFAVKITITDLGADASPVIVEELEDLVTREVEHLVVGHETTRPDS